MRRWKFWLVAMVVFAIAAATAVPAGANSSLTPQEQLGKALYFDTSLSAPTGMACATCHAPSVGFTGPVSEINATTAVYPGAVPGRYGNRKPPAASYAGDSPILSYDMGKGSWVGGMFWDGRATGWTLGDPLAEQALGPFLNPLEHNLPNAQAVIGLVKASDYSDLFEEVYGEGSLDMSDPEATYVLIGRAIAAYERSNEVSRFSSDFDVFWDAVKADTKDPAAITVANWDDYKGYGLSNSEVYGLALFNDSGKGGCSGCHTLVEGSDGYPLLTDFTYDNLGTPKNPENPFYDALSMYNPDGANWIDPGLGGFLKSAGYDVAEYEAQWGKQKVPTLRNVDKRPSTDFVKAYTHNGYFRSLDQIVHFYNTRDVEGAGWMGEPWPMPEVAENVNTTEIGNLGLTSGEEQAIVKFLSTLSDQ